MTPRQQLRLAKNIVEVLMDLEKDTAELRADIEENGVALAGDSANFMIRNSLINLTQDFEAVNVLIEMERHGGIAMHEILADAPKCRPTTIIR